MRISTVRRQSPVARQEWFDVVVDYRTAMKQHNINIGLLFLPDSLEESRRDLIRGERVRCASDIRNAHVLRGDALLEGVEALALSQVEEREDIGKVEGVKRRRTVGPVVEEQYNGGDA